MMYDPLRLDEIEARGMMTSFWASEKPDAPAVHDRFGSKTFAQVNTNANRLVRLLRDEGIVAGDHIAMLTSNRSEVVEIMAANLRGGYCLTPVNWRLTAEEIAYLVNDCDATALIAEDRFSAVVEAVKSIPKLKAKIALDGTLPGFLSYADELARRDGSDIPDPVLGNTMFYTSGTTGRPKGVYRPKLRPVGASARGKYDPDHDVQLCVSPSYHGAGLTLDTRTSMMVGVPIVFIDRWDSELVLQTIEKYKITHVHLVPIMFQRLLALPLETRARYDLSSLKNVIHGAAPCPPDVKIAMIEWLGPILNEYYSATEGGAGFSTTSAEWLARPGTLGKKPAGTGVKILGEDGQPCPPNVPGTIYYQRLSATPFQYYKDPAKTKAAQLGDYFTLGDIGYFDQEDYLFLTGRVADIIIAGGVNIYPQEIDTELLKHPAVEDSGAVGVPNTEWGEEVKAVVTLRPGFESSEALAKEIIDSIRPHLAPYKMPRSLDFAKTLPRNAAGKIERNKIRAPYWEGRKVQI